MKEITFSESIMMKLLKQQFIDITDKGWVKTALLWCIDSKYRRYKAVDKFLSNQIDFPDPKLQELANKLKKKTPSATVTAIEEYVIRNLRYLSDKKAFDKLEYWAEAKETLGKKYDDCEGLNGLIFILCRLAGIHYINLYCALGKTSGGYHFWSLFYYARKHKLVKLDAAYWPKVESIDKKKEFKLGKNYVSIDYVFNDKYIFKYK